MKRKKLQLILILLVFLGVIVVFYLKYPQIWGEIFYPLEYKQEILTASEEFDIPRNLIAAVIFSESRFNPQARSHAGASGLMQLMPGTARGVANRLGMTDYTDGKIFNPAVNIRLGSAYIKAYWDKYNQDVDALLVAYNAGPGVSGRFIQNHNRDVLPRETSGYLRKVRSAWLAYDRIYGPNWEGAMVPAKEESFIEKIDIFNLLDVLQK